MRQVDSGTAYVFWLLWLMGLGGAQRIYTGNFASGVIYLFTWGLFGFGQLLDLALIPGMVDRRNRTLMGGGNASDRVNHHVTLSIGDVPQPHQPQSFQSPTVATPMQRLLRAAKENGGQLSVAQATMYTELEPEEVRKLLQEAQKYGLADIDNHAVSGAVRYHFDV